jgi:hypothetical protein
MESAIISSLSVPPAVSREKSNHGFRVEIFLETRENLSNFIRLSEVGHGILDRILLFDEQQLLQFS